MSNENKQNDERAAFDDVKPLVDEWMRSRETCMDGTAYGAAIELAAFVNARATQQATTGDERARLDGAENFACYLIDNCEGETIKEEFIQSWLGKMLKNPRYACATTSSTVAGSAGQAPIGWKLVPIEPTKEMVAQACKDHGYPFGDSQVYARGYRSMLSATPVVPATTVPEGCTPADAAMLREANHALAAENDRLRRALAPFARIVSTDKLSWAMVEYCVEGDPEKQTFRCPQMQRAFNRAAEIYGGTASAKASDDDQISRVAGELCAISNDVRYASNRRAMFESVLIREYGSNRNPANVENSTPIVMPCGKANECAWPWCDCANLGDQGAAQ